MRKDEIDGFFQRHQKKLFAILAVSSGGIAAIALQAACMTLPEDSRGFCLTAAPMASKAIADAVRNEGGPELCPDADCGAIFGPAYSVKLSDGGHCRCISR